MKKYVKPQSEVYIMETEGPLAGSMGVHHEVGNTVQYSKRNVWSSENWMDAED